MANHCAGCIFENGWSAESLSDTCPGCPECADAAEWHTAIMAETCREDEHHCACVPVLRKACADRDEQLYRLGDELAEARLEIAKLRTATRKVVGAAQNVVDVAFRCSMDTDAIHNLRDVLSDPVIVALGRE
jgi:hypothetical protein